MSTDAHSSEAIAKHREFETQTHAQNYAQFRPKCSTEMVETFVGYCKVGLGESGKLRLALDLGCGSGQSTEPLSDFFEKVIGVEISPNQIEEANRSATKPSNVSYKAGPAEDLSFQADESVDLITVGQALHWFELDTFYAEVRRVLRPGGVFAAYFYNRHQLDYPEATDFVEKMYVDPLGPYWHEKIKLVDDNYVDIPAPFQDLTRRLDRHRVLIPTTLAGAVNYVTSWSAYQNYIRAHPESAILEEHQNNLLRVYTEKGAKVKDPEEIKVTMTFVIKMMLSRKPLTK